MAGEVPVAAKTFATIFEIAEESFGFVLFASTSPVSADGIGGDWVEGPLECRHSRPSTV